MTQSVDVEVVIHGKPYTLSCQRGQEGHLRKLAEITDERVNKLWRQVGKKMVLSETKLLVMTLLMLADELFDAKSGAHAKDTGTAPPAPSPAHDPSAEDEHYANKIQSITDKIATISHKLAVPST